MDASSLVALLSLTITNIVALCISYMRQKRYAQNAYGIKNGRGDLYKQIGDHLKNHFQGFDGYIFTGNLELLKSIGLRTKKKIILKNGMIDCRLAYYPLKSGKY